MFEDSGLRVSGLGIFTTDICGRVQDSGFRRGLIQDSGLRRGFVQDSGFRRGRILGVSSIQAFAYISVYLRILGFGLRDKGFEGR